MASDKSTSGTERSDDLLDRIECPATGCDWSTEFDGGVSPNWIVAEVNAEVHWERHHGGQVPDEAPFGDHQCPQCDALDGLSGTVSCSECGFVPEEVRA